MKHILCLMLLILSINSCTISNLSKYPSIKNINRENQYCSKRYSKEGKFLNGAYKIKYDKNYTTYATYRDGYYQKVLNKSNGFIWSKEKYDNNNDLVEYTSYMNKKNNDVSEYYQIQKYDSVKTFFLKSNPIKSIFYDKNNIYNINYKIEQQKMKIMTNIKDFKIINSLDVFSAIPSDFFFSNCHNGKFLYSNSYDVGWRNEYLYIEIIDSNGKIRNQTFKLNNPQKKEDYEINFYDYTEI